MSNGREQGLYGSEVELADGTTVTADAAYVEESLADPGTRVVDGYNHIMPASEPRPGEVYALVAYCARSPNDRGGCPVARSTTWPPAR